MAYVTALQRLKNLWAAGDYRAALKLAASWGQLGAHKGRITTGWAAVNNADFYRAIGRDPDALVADGLAAVAERYNLPQAPAGVSV